MADPISKDYILGSQDEELIKECLGTKNDSYKTTKTQFQRACFKCMTHYFRPVLLPRNNRQGIAIVVLISAGQAALKAWLGQLEVVGFTGMPVTMALAFAGGVVGGGLYFPRLQFPRYRLLAYLWGCLVMLLSVGLVLVCLAWQGSANQWINMALFVIAFLISHAVYLTLARVLWGREVSTLSSRFKTGQVWRYKTRSHEPDSSLMIIQVDFDMFEKEPMVSIYVNGLHVSHPIDGQDSTDIMHLPLTESAMQKSVTELIEETGAISEEMLSAYGDWKRLHEWGKAGVFCMTVAEILTCMSPTQESV